jgi:hypothetical protein
MTRELPFGAEYRHQKRIEKWRKATSAFPKFRHDIWWWLHNVVSHPLLGVWPSEKAVWFHDYTSQKLNRRKKLLQSPLPEIPNFLSWAKHNVIAHTAIGLFPSKFTFDWHDRTADEMNVEDWS